MSSSDDIANLFKQFGGKPSQYQEIGRENTARDSRQRWPLLAALDPGDASTPPPVVRGTAAEARGESSVARGARPPLVMPAVNRPSVAASSTQTFAPVAAPVSVTAPEEPPLPPAIPADRPIEIPAAMAVPVPAPVIPPAPAPAPVAMQLPAAAPFVPAPLQQALLRPAPVARPAFQSAPMPVPVPVPVPVPAPAFAAAPQQAGDLRSVFSRLARPKAPPAASLPAGDVSILRKLLRS